MHRHITIIGVLIASVLIPPTASAKTCPALPRTLSFGSRGTDVAVLQRFLIGEHILAGGSATGFYGPLTRAAIKDLQCRYGIVCDGSADRNGYGIAGPRTRAAIARSCAQEFTSRSSTSTPSVTATSIVGNACPVIPVPRCSTGTEPQALGIGASGCSPGYVCSPMVLPSCAWDGGTIASGQVITAYRTSSVPAGSSCESQQRTCTDGTLSGSYTNPYCFIMKPPPPSSAKPLIGAFRWDGWFPTVSSVFPQHIPPSLFTDQSYREPVYGWFDVDVPDAQALMDRQINDAADHGLDFWAFDDYMYTDDVAGIDDQRALNHAYKAYLASSYKNRLRFALAQGLGIASAGGRIAGYFRSAYVPYLVRTFKDPQYLKVEGDRPVLFWFADGGGLANFPNWEEDRAFLNEQVRTAGLGDVLFVSTTMDMAAARNHKLDAMTTYGVMGNGATPTAGCASEQGNSWYHCAYEGQSAKDISNWNTTLASDLLVVPGLTPVNDSRGIRNPYGFYVDQPTYSQWEQEVREAFVFMETNRSKETNPPFSVIYAWNELAEGGPGIIPTKQNGTMYLDAIKAVKTGDYPAIYRDVYNGDSAMITRGGPATTTSWINYAPVRGNFNNDEEISLGFGETATLTADKSTGFEVFGTRGPNRGKMEVFVDGVSQGIIALTSPVWDPQASLFRITKLSPGSHILRIVNVSADMNASQIGVDKITVSKIH